MGKRREYSGNGNWLISVCLPEPLAKKVHAVLTTTGLSYSEFMRGVLAAHVEKASRT